jgi:hypothetical protein
MAVNSTGITPLANHLPTVWSDELSEATQEATGLAGLVDRSFEDELKFGRVIAIQNRSNPAIRMKTEDTTATWANITETQQTLTINKQAYAAFLVEDIAEIQSKYDERAQYTEAAGYSIMAFVEGDLTSGLVSLGSTFTNLGGTLGAPPADDDVIAAKTALDVRAAPNSDRFAWVTPGFANTLLGIDKFTSKDFGAPDDVVRTGSASNMLYGFKVMVSNLAYNNPSGGLAAGQSYNWFGHKRGVALVMQRAPQVHTQYIILETADGVLIDCIYNFVLRTIPPSTLGGGTADNKFMYAIRAN